MNRLVRLYPRRWRDQYGAELDQLVDDLRPMTAPMALDLVRGAVVTHLRWRSDVSVANSRAIWRGLAVTGVLWVLGFIGVYLTNVVFPPKTDDDTVPVLVSYLAVFAGLFLVGVLAARAGATRRGQVVAGLIAGAVLGLLSAGSYFIVDNVWLDVVSQQPQKAAGFAATGYSSMRDYLNSGLYGAAVFWAIFFGGAGAVLGLAGGASVKPRA